MSNRQQHKAEPSPNPSHNLMCQIHDDACQEVEKRGITEAHKNYVLEVLKAMRAHPRVAELRHLKQTKETS